MKNPFETAGELYAKHVMFPLVNNMKFHEFSKKVAKVNGKIYHKTGIDVMGVEHRDEEEKSTKAKLKKIGKTAIKSCLFGVGTDIYNANK